MGTCVSSVAFPDGPRGQVTVNNEYKSNVSHTMAYTFSDGTTSVQNTTLASGATYVNAFDICEKFTPSGGWTICPVQNCPPFLPFPPWVTGYNLTLNIDDGLIRPPFIYSGQAPFDPNAPTYITIDKNGNILVSTSKPDDPSTEDTGTSLWLVIIILIIAILLCWVCSRKNVI